MSSISLVSSLVWKFLERCGSQFVGIVVAVILARLLPPEYHGVLALALVLTGVLQIFVDSGFSSALIQKKDADDLDFSSVFYFNFGFCIALYLLLFLVAPYMAKYFAMPDLCMVVRTLGFIIVIYGFRVVQEAYIVRHLLFRISFLAVLAGSIMSGVIGIYMAYAGYGIWALVGQQLANNFLATLIFWFMVPWRPKWQFSLQRLKGLFGYGWKLLASGLLSMGFGKFQQAVIGKMYQPAELAFYTRADQFPNVIIGNIDASINAVLLPTMSAEQDNVERVRAMTRRAIKTSTLMIMPIMMGLAICAEPAVRLVLTDKWLLCTPYLQIFCFQYAFWPIHTSNLQAMKALGHSDYFLYLEVIKQMTNLIVLLLVAPYGVMAIALTCIPMSFFGQVVNAWPNKKLLGYSYWEQLKDMLPQILLTCFMGVVLWFTGKLPLPDWQMLIMQFVIGASVYVSLAYIFKLESFNYLLNLIRGIKKQNDN